MNSLNKSIEFIVKFILLFFALSSSAWAANHYITPSGAGSRGGFDWSNACQGFTGSCAPSSMVRGDTYVIAGGIYTSSVTFNKATSGSTYIFIRKAQSGTYNGVSYNDDLVTGWSSSYETAQAVFSSSSSNQWIFTTAYWDINGVTPATKWATIGYGIKLYPAKLSQNNYLIISTKPTSNMRFQNIEFQNAGQSYNYEQFQIEAAQSHYLYVAYCYFYSGQNHIRIWGAKNSTIEYNNIGPVTYHDAHHGEQINMGCVDYSNCAAGTTGNTTIRYNFFSGGSYDSNNTTGVIIDLIENGSYANDGVFIYGNVFKDQIGHNGIGSGNSGSPGQLLNWKLFSNTFINSTVSFSRLSTGSALINNIFYGSSAEVFAGSAPAARTNNYFNKSTNSLGSCTNCVTSTESITALFPNYASGDYHPGPQSAAVGKGYALGNPYDKDADGVTMSNPATIGAFQYSDSKLTTFPNPPQNLRTVQ